MAVLVSLFLNRLEQFVEIGLHLALTAGSFAISLALSPAFCNFAPEFDCGGTCCVTVFEVPLEPAIVFLYINQQTPHGHAHILLIVGLAGHLLKDCTAARQGFKCLSAARSVVKTVVATSASNFVWPFHCLPSKMLGKILAKSRLGVGCCVVCRKICNFVA